MNGTIRPENIRCATVRNHDIIATAHHLRWCARKFRWCAAPPRTTTHHLGYASEYTTVEGKRLSFKNYYSQGLHYVKSRESSTIIYLKFALFRSHSCPSFAKIDKISNLLQVTKIHNHSEDAHNSDKIVLRNNIRVSYRYFSWGGETFLETDCSLG